MDVTDYDTSRSFLLENVAQQLENEILDTLLTSKHLRFNLAQLARSYGVPTESIEQIAQVLSQKHLGVDIERIEFQSVIKQIEKLEQDERDPGMREWKLQALARRFKRTPRQMMDVYNKACCQRSQVKPLTIAEFRAQYEQDVDWTIQGWLPKGTTVLFHAEGGVGKTLFVYEILESISQGKPWNGYATSQGAVLLVQADEPSLVTSERLNIRGIRDADPVYILPEWQVESMPLLEQWVEQVKPSLIIVDSLTAINRHCIFSENDTEYARPLLQLASLADRYGCACIIIHHSNAEGNSRGTRAIFNSVSEVWGLSNGDGTEKLLRVQKTRLGRPPGRYKFLFDDDDFSFRYLGEENQGEDWLTQEDRIRLWLSEDGQRGTSYAPVEVSEALGIGRTQTRRALRELWAKGLIRRTRTPGSGYYTYFCPKNRSICPNQLPDVDSERQAIGANTPIASPIADRSPLKNSEDVPHSEKAYKRSEKTENSHENVLENSRSLVRFSPETSAPSELEGGSISVHSSDHDPKKPLRNVNLQHSVTNAPLTHTQMYVTVDGQWKPAKLVMEKGMKLHKPTRSLQAVYRVKVGEQYLDVFESEIEWREPEK